MEIVPIADFSSPMTSKFGIPRQGGLAPHLAGRIVFRPEYRSAEALRGLEGFDYLWIIWGFSANKSKDWSPTVRPPRLGGNARMGVFATRSPFRPNPLGLSAVKISGIDFDTPDGPVIKVEGADIMDGTPIYDIKPYVEYADSRPGVRSGFVDDSSWEELEVVIPDGFPVRGPQLQALVEILRQDPRPQYQDDPEKIYGMPFGGYDIKFRVEGNKLTVLEAIVP